MADKKSDPTVRGPSGPEYPEGTHPAKAASEVTHAADKLKYKDASEKPDPTTVAQEQVVD